MIAPVGWLATPPFVDCGSGAEDVEEVGVLGTTVVAAAPEDWAPVELAPAAPEELATPDDCEAVPAAPEELATPEACEAVPVTPVGVAAPEACELVAM